MSGALDDLLAQVQILNKDHDFCERQRINQCEAMVGKINVILGQNHRLIQ